MKLKIVFFTFCVLFNSPFTFAGGFLYNFTSGQPTSWQNPQDIVVHPETGACGDYSNGDMITIIQEGLTEWSSSPDVDLGFLISENEIGSVTADNFEDAYYGYYFDDNHDQQPSAYADYNPIIFDNDGQIFSDQYGCHNVGYYLGVATITGTDSTTGLINRAAFVLNCSCFREDHTVICDDGYDPCDTSIDYSENSLRATFKHEMGHFLNLDHTPLNDELMQDSDDTNDTFVPLMYPYLQNPDRDFSPKQDDLMALATLYPSDSFEDSYCLVSGVLTDSTAEQNELQCAQVIATNSDPNESVSFISGASASGLDANGDNDIVDYNTNTESYESSANRGAFELRLKPGETYEISIASINPLFVGSGQVNPCKNEQLDACTTEILNHCQDDDESTDCVPCVENQILITSTEYESTYQPQCIGGETITLGNLIASDSISLESSINLNGGRDTVGDDDDSDTSSSSSCSLNVSRSVPTNPLIAFVFALIIFYIFKRPNLTKRNL